MRRAMAEAEVGDDGYGEDPTVNRLEATYAERVGKEAAVFVPSGTMANQLALRVLAPPGTIVVVGRNQHVVVYELGAAAVNSAVQLHLVDDADGMVAVEDICWAMAATEHHQPEVGAVFVENTHMPAGGAPWDLGRLRELAALGLPVHQDGARLFNAEVATGISAAEYAAASTTVMSCLSKGLGAPVGSLLAGSVEVIDRARDERKRLGGSMRQAGVLAAAGLLALEQGVDRLAEDHQRARRLAEAVASRWPGSLDPSAVRTNVVLWEPPDPAALLTHLSGRGVQADTIGPGVVRLMTHLDVDDAGLDQAITALEDAD